jgi:hypothetical protein
MAGENDLREGALVMMDALGTKDIWKKKRGDVLAKLIDLRVETDEYFRTNVFPGGVDAAVKDPYNSTRFFRCMFLSDTIVVGVQAKPENTASGGNVVTEADHYKDWSTRMACGVASQIMRSAIASEPVLAYRGCVTYGAFAFADQFFVGPAVNEAARWMEQSEGAFVWLTPKAAARLDFPNQNAATLIHSGLFRYTVPLKGGSGFRTYAVSPFTNSEPCNLAEREVARTRLLGSFDDDDVNVQIKKQNTEMFLEAADIAAGG